MARYQYRYSNINIYKEAGLSKTSIDTIINKIRKNLVSKGYNFRDVAYKVDDIETMVNDALKMPGYYIYFIVDTLGSIDVYTTTFKTNEANNGWTEHYVC